MPLAHHVARHAAAGQDKSWGRVGMSGGSPTMEAGMAARASPVLAPYMPVIRAARDGVQVGWA